MSLKGLKRASPLFLLLIFMSAYAHGEEGPSLLLGSSFQCISMATALSKKFMSLYPGTQVKVEGTLPEEVMKKVIAGDIHFGLIQLPVTSPEPRLTFTPLAHEGVAVVVSAEIYNFGLKDLSMEQLTQIWKGSILNWQQVGGPVRPIAFFDRPADSALRQAFMHFLGLPPDEPAPRARTVMVQDSDVRIIIASSDNAISLLPSQLQSEEVVALAIRTSPRRSIAPTWKAVATEEYPILKTLNLVSYGPLSGEAKSFLELARGSAGRQILEQMGLAPVTEAGETP